MRLSESAELRVLVGSATLLWLPVVPVVILARTVWCCVINIRDVQQSTGTCILSHCW
jgi:hypothetical protein